VSLNKVCRVVATGAFLSGVLLVQALPVEAASDPAVIAVHQNGAVDVPGNSTFGPVASMSVPAGNWSITATATVIGTADQQLECRLYAGTEYYATQTHPRSQGIGSYQPIVLLLAHHFAKSGKISIQCETDGWIGADLIRDIHVTAVQVGQLFDGGTTTGTGSPQAYYVQDPSERGWTNNGTQLIQAIRLPAGTWYVQAAAWGFSAYDGDRIDCTLASTSGTADQTIGDFQNATIRNLSLIGVVTLSIAGGVTMKCKDAAGLWVLRGSAMSALQVGTLAYGPLGGAATTTGTGSPNVVGGYINNGGITDATTPAPVGNLSLGAGSWFVTSKLSFEEGASTPNVTCQTKLGTSKDQGRAILDGGNESLNFSDMSLTGKLSAAGRASVLCDQTGGSLAAFFADLKVFAIKAGSLTDTDLD
jgi:hypothetical protein